MKAVCLLLCAMSVSLALCACDNSDDLRKVSTDVLKAFEQRYPNAVNVDWDKHGKYYVAEFRAPYAQPGAPVSGIPAQSFEMEAWFDSLANWRMTVIDANYTLLPPEVTNGFTASKYASWRVDDVAIVELNGKDPVYILEIEHKGAERALYFNARGEITKDKNGLPDSYKDLL